MHRLMEPDKAPEITRGTLEGQIMPGPITLFRLQSSSDGRLQSYIAEGEILDIAPGTFGGTGIVAIPDFTRFYRQVLVGGQFPHHGAFGFKKAGRIIFEALKLLEVDDISAPLRSNQHYPNENPF